MNDAIHTAGRVYSPQFHTDTRPAVLIRKRAHLDQYIPKYYKLISKHKNVKLKLTLTQVLTLTDTGSAVLTLMLGYRSLYITWQHHQKELL